MSRQEELFVEQLERIFNICILKIEYIYINRIRGRILVTVIAEHVETGKNLRYRLTDTRILLFLFGRLNKKIQK